MSTVSFTCWRCEQAGNLHPPTLAVAGDVPETGGATVIVRVEKARRWTGVELPADWATATISGSPLPAGNVAVARLLPRARHRSDVARGAADSIRAPFVELKAGLQFTIHCPYGHHGKGDQVSKSSLIRKAGTARAAGKRQAALR